MLLNIFTIETSSHCYNTKVSKLPWVTQRLSFWSNIYGGCFSLRTETDNNLSSPSHHPCWIRNQLQHFELQWINLTSGEHKAPIWLCKTFCLISISLCLIWHALCFFFFSHCQSPDTHRKETKCLPGNNPSKTRHLRHLSHPCLCI